jgi:DNA polymerase III epsilon subunit-like protein
VNGYTPEAWADAYLASSQAEGAARMFDTLKGCILVGHNVSFDVDFIKATIARHMGEDAARKLGYHKIDTVTIAFEHLAPCGLDSVSLVNVCTFLGLSNEGAHSAMSDVLRCQKVYDKLSRAGWFQRLVWKLRAPKPEKTGK